MISLETYFGGAHGQSVASVAPPLLITPRFARFWSIRAGAGSLYVRLEDPTLAYLNYGPGCPHLLIWNSGGTHAFDLQRSDATTLVSLAVGEAYEVNLISTATTVGGTSTATYAWDARKRLRMT